MFNNLNDYELIYLYKEKSNRAFNLLVEKYTFLIKKIFSEKGLSLDIDDAYQNSLLILFKCIKSYDMNCGCPFFNYYLVCLKREVFRTKKKEINYLNQISYNDEYHAKQNYLSDNLSVYDYVSFLKESDKVVFKEIFIENLSPRTFAKKYNLTVKKVYNLIYSVKQKLKNYK